MQIFRQNMASFFSKKEIHHFYLVLEEITNCAVQPCEKENFVKTVHEDNLVSCFQLLEFVRQLIALNLEPPKSSKIKSNGNHFLIVLGENFLLQLTNLTMNLSN